MTPSARTAALIVPAILLIGCRPTTFSQMQTGGGANSSAGPAPPFSSYVTVSAPPPLALPPRSPAPPTPSAGPGTPWSSHIMVDQFGYRPGDQKVAVISVPKVGFNASSTYSPSSTYQVVPWPNGSTPVYTGSPTTWNSGRTEAASGDQGAWFDFSSMSTPGTYYIYDPTNRVRSSHFTIGQNVFAPILNAATRYFYYQRMSYPKSAPYSDPPNIDTVYLPGKSSPIDRSGCWVDAACFLQAGQGVSTLDQSVHDVGGGWFDAGNFDHYMTWNQDSLNQLLSAYRENPGLWPDDSGIPESGNGMPDVLDEVMWQLEWVKRMQNTAGVPLATNAVGAGMDIGHGDPGPPPLSQSTIPITFDSACTSSTISAASMFAHAANVFSSNRFTGSTIPVSFYTDALSTDLSATVQLGPHSIRPAAPPSGYGPRLVFHVQTADYASDLATRAVSAWNAFARTTANYQSFQTSGCDQHRQSDISSSSQMSIALSTAIYLWALTGRGEYHAFIATYYKQYGALSAGWVGTAGDPNETLADALLYYARLPGADPSIKSWIVAQKQSDLANNSSRYYAVDPANALYRATMIETWWGASAKDANIALSNWAIGSFMALGSPSFAIPASARVSGKQATPQDYVNEAEDVLHFMNGVNPLAMTFLTNMYSYGAEKSANESWHQWFLPMPSTNKECASDLNRWVDAVTSTCGPAPGYLVGGPNNGYYGSCPEAPAETQQPPLKAYHDSDSSACSWAWSESDLGYQSAYVKLLSKFAR